MIVLEHILGHILFRVLPICENYNLVNHLCAYHKYNTILKLSEFLSWVESIEALDKNVSFGMLFISWYA